MIQVSAAVRLMPVALCCVVWVQGRGGGIGQNRKENVSNRVSIQYKSSRKRYSSPSESARWYANSPLSLGHS